MQIPISHLRCAAASLTIGLSLAFCLCVQSGAQTTDVQPPSTTKLSLPVPSQEVQEMQKLLDEGGKAYSKADSATALKAFQAGLEKARALKDERFVARFLNSIGVVYDSLDQIDKALDFYQKALVLRDKLGDVQDITISLTNIGLVYNLLGQFDKALSCFQRVLALFEKLNDSELIAKSLNNIGSVYNNLSQFDKALDFYQRALALFEKLGDSKYIAGNLNNVGTIYYRLGQFDKALDFDLRALALFEKIGNPRVSAYSLDNIGTIYDSLAQFDKALSFHHRALSLFEKLGDSQHIAESLNNIGSVYHHHGQFDKALDFYQRSLVLKEKLRNSQGIANSLDNMGAAYDSLAQFDKALDFYQRALMLREKLGNQQDIAGSLTAIGKVYAKEKLFAQAEDAYRRALVAFERAEQGVGEASEVGAFQAATGDNLHVRYADVLLSLHRPNEALEMVERGQGQGLARRIRQGNLTLTSLLSAADTQTLQRQESELTQAGHLFQELNATPLPAGKAGQEKLSHDLTEAKTHYNKASDDLALLRSGLFRKYPRYAERQGQPVSVTKLFRLSKQNPDTLYLEYAPLDEKTTLLFALHNDSLTPYRLPVGDKALSTLTQRWRSDLTDTFAADAEPRPARALYKAVLLPVERTGGLKGIGRLVVVANGPLLDVPFAALLDGKGQRLIERFPISNAFSLASLTWHDTPPLRPAPRDTLLCVADTLGEKGQRVDNAARGGFGPLPHARSEGQAVYTLYPGMLLIGSQGKEETVKTLMSRFRLLHFAVHGDLDNRDGMRSALVLAKEPENAKEDGFLEAREVAEIPLSAQLAVLSACNSGQGQKSGGEGLLGLAWAFRAAGVPAIVASQWSVDDTATSRLMVAFYKELKAGQRKDAALRKAMLAVKQTHSAPFYWAAFQVLGETSALTH